VPAYWATRVVVNVTLRFPYLFLSEIAAGLGVRVGTVTGILAIRELSGLLSPAIGRFAQRRGLSLTMLNSIGIAGLATIASAFGGIVGFTLGMAVAGIGVNGVIFGINTWVSHEVPVLRRARVIGVIETSWAISFLLGAPAIGLAIGWWGWRGAIVASGAMVLAIGLGGATTWYRSGVHPMEESPPPGHAATYFARNPAARRAMLIFCAAQPVSQMLIFAVNGDWFTTQLHLSVSQVATVGAALGVAELLGTVLVAASGDRLGPRLAGGAAMGATAVLLLITPLTSGAPLLAVGLLVLMDIAMEFGFVVVWPHASETDRGNRERAIGEAMVAITLSRAVGSLVAGMIYQSHGFTANCLLGAAACVIGGLAIIRFRP
jgi:predicted MFS family arabinose efflux permease